jgi:RND family efflux transporter MFP subunit
LVSIPEEMVIRLDDIHTYSVEFESYPGKQYPAVLKEIGLAVQHGRQTYPLQVHVDLPPDAKVFPGMTAMVRINLVRPHQVQMIPLTALIGSGEETAVWVIKDNTIHRRPVKVLGVTDNNVEIGSGLEPHEKIVVAGTRSLREGQTVRVSPEPLH